MNNIEKTLEILGLSEKSGFYEGEDYIVILDDSDDFAKMYTLLDNANWLSSQNTSLSLQQDVTLIKYSNDNISLILSADFTEDKYLLKLEEK